MSFWLMNPYWLIANNLKQGAQSHCDIYHQRGTEMKEWLIEHKTNDFHKETHFGRKNFLLDTMTEEL